VTKKNPAVTALLRCSPIKVGSNYFNIKIVPNKDWTDGEGYIGLLSFQDREMRLRGNLRGYILIDAAFHECLHAIWNESLTSPLDRWITSNKVPVTPPIADVEEVVVCAYETGIAALFLDNPKLLKLFTHYWQPAARKRKD
jgi:hypothetical protein